MLPLLLHAELFFERFSVFVIMSHITEMKEPRIAR